MKSPGIWVAAILGTSLTLACSSNDDASDAGLGGAASAAAPDATGGDGVETPVFDASGGGASAPTGGTPDEPGQPESTGGARSDSDALSGEDASEGVDGPTAPGVDGGAPPVSDPVAVNPFVMVAHDPLSTFAADVDTASYDIFRRDVGQAALPTPSSVRVEEFVNAFHYDYAAPDVDDAHPFAIHLAAATGTFAPDRAVLRVALAAARPDPRARGDANLVFLVDTSGSMSDELPWVKDMLLEAVALARPTDRVALVSYASGTELVLPSTPVSQRAAIEAAIASLAPGGDSAGASGIALAYDQASAGFITDGINGVVLCTDGDFNVGTTDPSELIAIVEQHGQEGIYMNALGFGTWQNNDALMQEVSNAGDGIYSVIASHGDAIEYARTSLFDSLQIVAKDVKLQVEFNEDEVVAYRLLGYENRDIADEDFTDDSVDAGEIGAGHQVTALYELVLTGGTVPTPPGAPAAQDGPAFALPPTLAAGELVRVRVRYLDPSGLDTAGRSLEKSLETSDVAASAQDAGIDFEWAIAVSATAETLRGSPFVADSLLPAISQLVERPRFDGDPRREEFRSLLTAAIALSE